MVKLVLLTSYLRIHWQTDGHIEAFDPPCKLINTPMFIVWEKYAFQRKTVRGYKDYIISQWFVGLCYLHIIWCYGQYFCSSPAAVDLKLACLAAYHANMQLEWPKLAIWILFKVYTVDENTFIIFTAKEQYWLGSNEISIEFNVLRFVIKLIYYHSWICNDVIMTTTQETCLITPPPLPPPLFNKVQSSTKIKYWRTVDIPC